MTNLPGGKGRGETFFDAILKKKRGARVPLRVRNHGLEKNSSLTILFHHKEKRELLAPEKRKTPSDTEEDGNLFSLVAAIIRSEIRCAGRWKETLHFQRAAVRSKWGGAIASHACHAVYAITIKASPSLLAKNKKTSP